MALRDAGSGERPQAGGPENWALLVPHPPHCLPYVSSDTGCVWGLGEGSPEEKSPQLVSASMGAVQNPFCPLTKLEADRFLAPMVPRLSR